MRGTSLASRRGAASPHFTGKGAASEAFDRGDMPTDELMEMIRQWAAERWPRGPAVSVVVKLLDGVKVTFSLPDVPYRPSSPASAPDAGEKVYPHERRILKIVAAMKEDEPTIAQVAAAAKFKNDPFLRKMLSLMRKRDLLGGEAGEDAYPLTPKGQAAPEAAPETF